MANLLAMLGCGSRSWVVWFHSDSLSMLHADNCGTPLRRETPIDDMPVGDMLCAYVTVLFGYLESQTVTPAPL